MAIVSEGFVRRFLPDEDALGKRIKYGDRWMAIVGVVGNVKYLGLTVDTDPAYYMPFAQMYGPRMFLAVRSGGDAARLVETLRWNIHSIDPGVTLAQAGTMEQPLALSVSQPHFDIAATLRHHAVGAVRGNCAAAGRGRNLRANRLLRGATRA